jgi:hypothetical protein
MGGNIESNVVAPAGGGGGGGGSGVDTVDTFSGSSQINGASITANKILFGPADGTNPGMVTTGSQTIAGAKTFSGAPTFSAGGNVTFSGGTNTKLTRSKAAINLMDSDSYLGRHGIQFYGGSTPTLLAEWDDAQFVISTRMEFFADATYDIGANYRPRNISASGLITAGGYIKAVGPLITGVTYSTSTGAITIASNISLLILDPASTTASQTITMPAAVAGDGEVVVISVGAQGITALTVNANTGHTIVGGGALGAKTATSMAWIFKLSNTTWYRYW